MPLPLSGTISLSSIALEFGGTAPHSISEYYRGGAFVANTCFLTSMARLLALILCLKHRAQLVLLNLQLRYLRQVKPRRLILAKQLFMLH